MFFQYNFYYLVLLFFSIYIGQICANSLDFSKGSDSSKKVVVHYSADMFTNGKKGEESFKKLLGNVMFKNQETIIYADSAYFYDEREIIEAYGHVKIVPDDSTSITADFLEYDRNKKIAKLRKNVLYRTDSASLYTDILDYKVEDKIGHFIDGGTLVQKNNTLTSEQGYYHEHDHMAKFYQKVNLTNPDYLVQCDTLLYNTITKIAYFQGWTTINNLKDSTIVTTKKGGEYNTQNEKSFFDQTTIETSEYRLSGNHIYTNDEKEFYSITGHVMFAEKENDIVLTGDYAQYWKKKGLAKIYGNTLISKVLQNDTLYFSADTVVLLQKDKELIQAEGKKENVLLAYHNVQIYKNDLQGIADSMAYHMTDSTLSFFKNPTFWYNKNQITADSVQCTIKDKMLEKMFLNHNAIMIEEDTLKNYNQIQGRNMTVFFQKEAISHILVDGNGEAIYFGIEDDLSLTGMNYLQCSHMRVDMDNEAVAKIVFYVQPIAMFYPTKFIKEKNRTLSSFIWRIDERPTRAKIGIGHSNKRYKSYQQFKFIENK